MPSMQGAQLRVGYTDLLTLPEDGRRYEIHDGELVVVPSPLPRHQLAARAIFLVLDAHARETGGDALFTPLDIVFDEHDVVQPDVVFFRAERRHLLQPDVAVRHPPDIVVEVLSASTAATDRGRKMHLFARHGVRECWVVDPVLEQIEIHALEGGVYRRAQIASGDDIARSVLLPELTFRAARTFAR